MGQLPTTDASPIRRALLRWYARSKRDLPWRRTADPYAIWISEIMLQQTRVAAVLPYYERFMKRFPTVAQLARAREEDVLHAWAGLGYYSRARNVHRAAGLIVAAGGFPTGYDGIRALPGIGDYTAAAIASIAFQQPYVAMDGNALRVLSRVTAEAGYIGRSETRERLRDFANGWLDRERPGDFNQAIMELGATVCTPRSPVCTRCPLVRYCAAYQRGKSDQYPIKARKMEPKEATLSLFYIERRGKVLFWRRDESSRRMAGFWELPGSAQLQRIVREEKAGEFRHTIVNTTFYFRVMRATIGPVPQGLVWLAKNCLHEVPLSTTAKKALLCLENRERK